ncbi:hypothetical protein L227DRAFT_581562 [Lentinus tigrinus ALCF2SS1-6]|uniref:Uncharacterized protein n=1 Tax=Lentinus tigrinus ALCF2SS1-6 TaxID=1328759 RepID=A0A5C2RPY5_9APHY|nr:hypothetical protein L227DRAFT_581562 [Lentinus tigrinus ALCF2SS1-6]
MQASSVTSTQPEAESPAGRLPKRPSKLIGPLKHLTANYQLYAAKQYYETGQVLVKGIGEEYPEWRKKPEFLSLVTDGNTVASYIDDAYDQDTWDREKNRRIKHEARNYCTSAYRSSKHAEREYVNDMVPKSPETEGEECVYSRPPSPSNGPPGNKPLLEVRVPILPPTTSFADDSSHLSFSAIANLRASA